jgi:hypothetical protein
MIITVPKTRTRPKVGSTNTINMAAMMRTVPTAMTMENGEVMSTTIKEIMIKGAVTMAKGTATTAKGTVTMIKGMVAMAKSTVTMAKGMVTMAKGTVTMAKGISERHHVIIIVGSMV